VGVDREWTDCQLVIELIKALINSIFSQFFANLSVILIDSDQYWNGLSISSQKKGYFNILLTIIPISPAFNDAYWLFPIIPTLSFKKSNSPPHPLFIYIIVYIIIIE